MYHKLILSDFESRESFVEAALDSFDSHLDLAVSWPEEFFPVLDDLLGDLKQNLLAVRRGAEGVMILEQVLLSFSASDGAEQNVRPQGLAAVVQRYLDLTLAIGQQPDLELIAPFVDVL